MKLKKNIKNFLFCTIVIFVGLIVNKEIVNAETKNKNLVNIYFFHSNDCSHCQSESELLDSLEKKYSNIKIYRYEIHEHKNNEKLKQVQELYQIKTNGVPLTIIGVTPYSGYKEDKSSIEFIKTIEYYSRYSYEDKVGELLQVEIISNYKIDKDSPTLEEFMESYGNYKLIGNLYTDDVNISLNAIILGVLSQLNIIKLISTLIILILLSRIGGQKNKLLLLTYYIGISFVMATTYIFSNDVYTLGIEIIILILFMIGLMGYLKNKKRQYLYGNIFIVIAIISNYLENYFFNNYNSIFKNLINLYNQSGIEKIASYINYIFTIGIINILVILVFYCIKKIIQKSWAK